MLLPTSITCPQKCKLAQSKLGRTTLPVSVISTQLGFLDPHHFSSFFKKQCGLSPGFLQKTPHSAWEFSHLSIILSKNGTKATKLLFLSTFHCLWIIVHFSFCFTIQNTAKKGMNYCYYIFTPKGVNYFLQYLLLIFFRGQALDASVAGYSMA